MPGRGGVEFAYLYRVFGAGEVLLVEALPRILPREDAEISGHVQGSLEKRGIRVETGARVADVARTGGGVRFQLSTASGTVEMVEVERLLVSIGIQPVTKGLDLDEAGVMRDPRGCVAVDEFMRTSAPGVYAIGDVTPTPSLANVASAEAIAVVEQIAGLDVVTLDYDRMPRGVYCRTEGLTKVVSDARYGEILGVHIFGAEAATMLGEAGVPLAYEYTDEELGVVSHAYPTLAEIVQEAALAAAGQAIRA